MAGNNNDDKPVSVENSDKVEKPEETSVDKSESVQADTSSEKTPEKDEDSEDIDAEDFVEDFIVDSFEEDSEAKVNELNAQAVHLSGLKEAHDIDFFPPFHHWGRQDRHGLCSPCFRRRHGCRRCSC